MTSEDIKSCIGCMIQSARLDKGFSQEEFADLIGISRASITNIEAGRQAVSLRALYLICCIVNESPSFFFPPLKPVKLSKKTVTRRIIIEKKRFKPIQ